MDSVERTIRNGIEPLDFPKGFRLLKSSFETLAGEVVAQAIVRACQGAGRWLDGLTSDVLRRHMPEDSRVSVEDGLNDLALIDRVINRVNGGGYRVNERFFSLMARFSSWR